MPDRVIEAPIRIRDLAVEIVDGLHGYTMELAPSPSHHMALYDWVEEQLARLEAEKQDARKQALVDAQGLLRSYGPAQAAWMIDELVKSASNRAEGRQG